MAIKIPELILYKELEEESVLLNLNTGEYYAMNQVATRMWKLLTELGSPDEVLTSVVAEYEVSHEQARQDLLELIKEWKSSGLVEEKF